MNKQEFLLQLGQRLSVLSPSEKEEQLTFYREMIEDRMEDGLSEEEAVSAVGSVDAITMQVNESILPAKTAPQKRLKAWEILLLILGSPIWLSLLIAGLAVVFSLYVSAWAVIIAFWSVFISFAACALGCIAAGIIFTVCNNKLPGIAIIGAGLVCAGLSIFLFFGCKAATEGTMLLTKKVAVRIKGRFAKKEVA